MKMTIGHNRVGGVPADQLKSIIARVERLEEEKAAIAEDIKDVYAEAKGNGFDTKTIRQIIKLRKLDVQEREEQEALLDIYMAALGMLGDTPLGEAAIRRLSQEKEAKKDKPLEQYYLEPKEDEVEKPEEQQSDSQLTIEDARKMARQAVEEGKSVTSNPFSARDPKRAAWDEEWCKASGSDGMELPESWRRIPKKKEEPEQPQQPEPKES